MMLYLLDPRVGEYNISRIRGVERMGRIRELERMEGIRGVEETIVKIR